MPRRAAACFSVLERYVLDLESGSGVGSFTGRLAEPATTVRAWEDGRPLATEGPFGVSPLPLAGFGIVEAADLDEAVRLVAETPCARARGAVELRPISMMNLPDWSRGDAPSRPSAHGSGELWSTPDAPWRILGRCDPG